MCCLHACLPACRLCTCLPVCLSANSFSQNLLYFSDFFQVTGIHILQKLMETVFWGKSVFGHIWPKRDQK